MWLHIFNIIGIQILFSLAIHQPKMWLHFHEMKNLIQMVGALPLKQRMTKHYQDVSNTKRGLKLILLIEEARGGFAQYG